MDAAKKITLIDDSIKCTIKLITDQLIFRMRNLAEDLNRNADLLKQGEELHASLGLIQGRGPTIDRMCSQLSTLYPIQKLVRE